MNTFWLKIAAIALVIVVAIILVGRFISPDSETPATEPEIQKKAEQRTFSKQVEEDKKRFLTEPQPVEERTRTIDPNQRIQRPEELEVPVKSLEERKQQHKEELASEKPIVLYFKPLDEIEKVEAERLLNVAVPGRSIGRLPMTGYNLMVENCRRIISKWPDSWYAYRAKQMLADIPESYWPRYKITEEEVNLSEFTKPKPGTKPFTVEDLP